MAIAQRTFTVKEGAMLAGVAVNYCARLVDGDYLIGVSQSDLTVTSVDRIPAKLARSHSFERDWLRANVEGFAA